MGIWTPEFGRQFWLRALHSAGGCLEWTGAKNGKRRGVGRYGVVKIDQKQIPAHRIAWQLHHRASILPGYLVCHSCDNPGCINPEHLWLGTPSENTRDAISKGRVITAWKQRWGPTKSRDYAA